MITAKQDYLNSVSEHLFAMVWKAHSEDKVSNLCDMTLNDCYHAATKGLKKMDMKALQSLYVILNTTK